MAHKIITYLKRSLDYPVDISLNYRDGLHYYLDLTRYFDQYPFSNILFDREGIIQFNYACVPAPNNKLGLQYNHTYIALWALANLHRYLSNGEDQAREAFIKHARWLREKHSQRNGHIVWQTMFDWRQYDYELKAPLVSSMDQGLAISVMVRAYKLTQESSYLELAKRAVPFYGVGLDEGGFRAQFKGDYIYYEMYPVRPLSKVLDGYAFALAGLYDVYLADGDKQAKEFFDQGVRTILENIDYWDFKGYWSWFGRFYLSPPWYHKLNFCWVNVLADISGEKGLKQRIRRWNPRTHNFIHKTKIKLYAPINARYFYWKVRRKKKDNR